MSKPTSDCRATERKHPWPMVRLGDVCEIIAGQSPEGSYYTDESCYTEFHQGSKSFGTRELQVSGVYTKKETKIAKPGSLLISVRAPVGDLNITTRRVCIGRGLAALIPDDSISRDFLWLFLTSATKAVNDAAGAGSCFSSLSRSQLSGLEIPLPPLTEQKEMVARLERELAAVEKMKKGFEALAETAMAEYVAECRNIFDEIAQENPKVSLDDACEFIKDGTHQTPTYTDDIHRGYKFLSSKDVVTGEIDWSKIRYIPKSLHDELYSHVAPQRGDILLAKNGTTGIGALVETDEVFDIYVSLALLRFKARNNPRYLWYAVNSPQAREQYNAGLKGSGVPNLHLTEIRKVHICLPSVQIQGEVVSELDAVKARAEKLEVKAREGVAVCETMRKAILKEAFDSGRKG